MPHSTPAAERIKGIALQILDLIIHGKHHGKSGSKRGRQSIGIFRQDFKNLHIIKKGLQTIFQR